MPLTAAEQTLANMQELWATKAQSAMENLGVLVRKGASHLCRARPKRRFLFYQHPRELHHLARFFRRWRLREAFGVRGACSRFRVSNHQRKRQQAEQAGRTPNASRGSAAAVPAVLRCAVSPISNRQAWKCPDRGASREVPQAGSPAIQQIGNRLEICATLTFSTRLRCAPPRQRPPMSATVKRT